MLNFRLENLYHKNLLLHLHHNESNSYQHQPITTTSGENCRIQKPLGSPDGFFGTNW